MAMATIATLNECAAKLQASDTSGAVTEYQAVARQLRDSLAAPSPQREIADLRRENTSMRHEIAERAELIAAHRERLQRWQAVCTDVQSVAQLAAEVGAAQPPSS